MSWDFYGTHSRVAERTRLFPSEGELGEVLGGEANLALRDSKFEWSKLNFSK